MIDMNFLPGAGREFYGCFKPSRPKKYYKEAAELCSELSKAYPNLGHFYYHEQE